MHTLLHAALTAAVVSMVYAAALGVGAPTASTIESHFNRTPAQSGIVFKAAR